MTCQRTGRRPPRQVRLTIDSLAFGGDGVGRDADGRVVFVPGTAPGDRVVVEVAEERKDFARAHLVRILTPSSQRVAPPCPLFVAGCGGCQWQHVSLAAQRAAKEDIVRRALRHVGVDIAPIVDGAPPYRWRRRARLRFRRGLIGYTERRSHRLIDVDACPQLEEPLEQALIDLRGRIDASGAGEIDLLLGGRGDVHVVVNGEASGPAIDLADAERPFWAAADVFAQVSARGNRELRRLVLEAAGDLAGARVLELFAGSGNFTRDLAARAAAVIAVEESAGAVALGRRNVPSADWRAQPAGAAWGDVGPVAVVVLDPPRTGLEPGLAERLVALAPARIVYVSCDPNTLARDLSALHGYLCRRATPVNLMPQTFHVEVVAELTRVG